ncbi:MAG TPA: TonB-dependent receptor [Steroidobacteraceae bacterium]|nr:TonB-dependent receptor [Steroidobacteraceae bacterium]
MVAQAIALALTAAAAQPALAQDAAEGELEEIVVTGFRASLEQSLSIKRDSAVAIDAILAEDIADFPDMNLAESLQRIPGVSIARDAGEGRQITVRGLGPQFTRVRINGMEALSTAGGTDATGGTNRSRSFDFNVFASELFSELAVRKTASAETEEGSLGATVDLRASRPFDFSGATFVTSVQGGYNDLNEEFDPRATMLMSNVFADGKLGALVSVAYTERKLSDDGASTVRWQTGGGSNNFGGLAPGYSSAATLADINEAYRPRIPRYDHYENEQERLGVTASLQFAPSDASEINFDVLYSKLDGKRYEMFLQAPVFSASGGSGIGNVDVREAEIQVKNGKKQLVYGVFDDVDIRSEQRYDELTTEFKQFTLEGKHDFGDGFKVHGLVGTSKSEHDNPVQTTLLFDALDVDGYTYDYRGGNSRLPYINYGTTDVTAASTWKLSQIRLRPQTADNSFDTGEVNVSYDFTDRMAIKGGLQIKKYEFETTELRRSNGTTSNQEAVIPGSVAGIPVGDYATIAQLSGLGAPNGTTLRWLVPDVRYAGGLLGLYDESLFPLGAEPSLGNNQAVKEDDTGFYLQFDFGFDIGSVPFRGNVGARYVQTDLTSTGYTYVGNQAVKITANHDYDSTLPSFNIVAELSEDLLLRASAARVMTRPILGNLAPSTTISVSGNNRTVTAGNPALEPFEADAYDLSAEWYFAEEAMLSLALFYKDIGSFISTTRDTRPFTGNPYGLPDELAIAACGNVAGCSPDADWIFSVPLNTPGGDLKGLEVSYQQPFSFLPGFASNFGMLLNYTRVESEVDYVDALGATVISTDLVGLSQNAWNATLYYEDDRFSTRLSGAYRDEYLTTVPGRNGADVEGTAETFNLDFSATWTFNDNLQFTFEALNLTDEFQDQWVDSSLDALSYYHHTGRQYYLGLRYKY